jgi:hypothetical protein
MGMGRELSWHPPVRLPVPIPHEPPRQTGSRSAATRSHGRSTDERDGAGPVACEGHVLLEPAAAFAEAAARTAPGPLAPAVRATCLMTGPTKPLSPSLQRRQLRISPKENKEVSHAPSQHASVLVHVHRVHHPFALL